MSEYAPRGDLRSSLRAFLTEASPTAETRRAMESTDGFDRNVWKRLSSDLGVLGMHVPTRYGGGGRSYRDLLIVFEESGHALLCSPLLSTVALAMNTVMASGDEQLKSELFPRIASGDTVVTVAYTEDNGRWDDAGVMTTAARRGDNWFLNGQKSFVIDGHAADVFIVAARMGDGISLFEVDGDATGLTRRDLPTMDQTRRLARIELAGTRARLVGRKGGGWVALSRGLDLTVIALAAEQVGGTQRCLEMAVAQAKGRVQFGRAIGGFQAVKHACADMLVALESARSALAYASGIASTDSSAELPLAASLAKASCSDAYLAVAAANVQLQGAKGCTWDHDAHLFLKRAKSSELLFGDPMFHRTRLAGHLGL
ncbi:MAG TPA: acyl-CoA dehydrogenase family protein [Acidimicrobiales bacterium]|nr:acyl-CoA dehydrogenase family protein [Acidimicrobiales bacterium]